MCTIDAEQELRTCIYETRCLLTNNECIHVHVYIYINIIMYEFMTAAVSGHELNRLRMQRLLNGC